MEKKIALVFDDDEYTALCGGFTWLLANYRRIEAGLDPVLLTMSRAELMRLARLFPLPQPRDGVVIGLRDLWTVADIAFALEGQCEKFPVGGNEDVYRSLSEQMRALWKQATPVSPPKEPLPNR